MAMKIDPWERHGVPRIVKADSIGGKAMPWFHFNSRTGDVLLPDTEGEEVSNLAAARDVAIASAREALAEALKSGDTPPDHIQVTDREGREVLIVPLEEVLKIRI